MIERPVTRQEIADVLGALSIEIVTALTPSVAVANERLESLASVLLDYVNGMPPDTLSRELLLAVAEYLVKTEDGAQT